jgi:hypothetical protein
MAKCIETRPIVACYTPSGGVPRTIYAHVVYEDGIPIGTAYTEATDIETPINVDFGLGDVVSAGACPVASPDVEWVKMCDKQLDGTVVKFVCRTVTYFDTTGEISSTVVDNFELDKTTPYAPTGEVGDCKSDCEKIGTVGSITDWSVLNP